ncbi:MAG: adenine-specific DNA-methyltransferase [Campylobacterota bacterium]|nr:adenine-specific DNA-methyltransferase [Campylobacterota bacterium]
MNYIGSKYRLSSWIKDTINKNGGMKDKIFCDIFAGTGAVARSVKKDVKQVIINDIEPYSYALNRNYIGNHIAFGYQEILEELNKLKPREGFVYKNYCLGGSGERQYFSDENGLKIDAIRVEIEKYKRDENLYYFLLASLLESADKVANTASVYGAYLKHLKKSAQKSMILEAAVFEENEAEHQVFNEDANSLIKKIEGDILYLDPPYNHREYGANYHILNTIALYDEFNPKGKSGLREYKKSRYCKKNEVHSAFEELVKEANFKYIFLSYNNEGIMSQKDVETIMKKYGSYGLETKEYQRFKADKTQNRNHKADMTFEYLHILEKY